MNGKSKGSGLAIYVREPFLFTVMEEYNQCSPNLESLFITISNTEQPLTIGVVYRPPSGNKSDFLSVFHTLLEKLPSSYFVEGKLIFTFLYLVSWVAPLAVGHIYFIFIALLVTLTLTCIVMVQLTLKVLFMDLVMLLLCP